MWFFQSDFFSRGNIPSIPISGIKPFTLAISVRVVQASSQLLGPHQLTEISHQLTLKIPTLIQGGLYRQPIVDNELVP